MNAHGPADAASKDEERAPITIALDATWAALNARMRNLRRSAFTAAGTLLAAPLCALVFRSPFPLLGLATLPLLGYVFTRRDRHLVSAWENLVLDLWAAGTMPMAVLVTSLSLQPGTLKSSLSEMLALLPAHGENLGPAPAEAGLRLALSATRQAREALKWARGLGRFAAGCALSVGVSAAWLGAARDWDGSARTLAACAAGLGAVAAAWILSAGTVIRWKWESRLAAVEAGSPWDPAALEADLSKADGSALPRGFRRRLQRRTAEAPR